jgi:hypothetical protein
MNMKHISALSLCLLLLTGCQSVKQELGIGRNSPDEFLVVKRAPLSVPPDFELRAPAPAVASAATESSNQAKTAILGQSATPAAAGTTSGEQALLQRVGVTSAAADIRGTINREAGYLDLKDKSVADRLIFWKDGTTNMDDENAVIVDAKAEKARLEQNKAEGRPVNTGEVPVIKRKTGTIDKLF